MKRSNVFDELVDRLGSVLPPGAAELKDDFENNARAAVQSALRRMDLVTREEFDVQVALLQRTREKVEQLERRLEAMQAETQARDPSAN